MASASSASSSMTSTRIAVPLPGPSCPLLPVSPLPGGGRGLLARRRALDPSCLASQFHRGYALSPRPRRCGGRTSQGWLPPIGGRPPDDGRRAGSWIAVAVALPLLSDIWAETKSPTLTAPMLVTLPVTRVELVTAAVTA